MSGVGNAARFRLLSRPAVKNAETGRKLLNDLCGGLESGEDKPVTPLVRKAIRLAALLEMTLYRFLFQGHLNGFKRPDPSRSASTGVAVSAEQKAARDAFIQDRLTKGLVMSHALPMLEELHARMVRSREEVGTKDIIDREFELRAILQRIRSRLGSFTIEAEKVLTEAETGTVAKLKATSMTLVSDASLVFRAVAEFEVQPGDVQRGYRNLTQHGVVATLKERWGVEMAPQRLNEAVDILENNGYIKVSRGSGTTPYKFSGVEITAGGRLQHEKQIEKVRAAETSEVRPKIIGTKVFFGHGGAAVWKEFRDYVRDRLQLDWDEFKREATAGYTTKERLEQMLDDAAFAFLVMTAEDERADGTKVARANVIHEVGLFQGRLGFKRAIVLLENGCEEFSNIHGVTQIHFDRTNTAAKFDEIRQTLEREGLVKK
jgi:predicted nucleotide-binding protein